MPAPAPAVTIHEGVFMNREDRTAYAFDTQNENYWDATQRLCEEVGWTFGASDGIASSLRAHSERVRASRAKMTRAEFIAALCERAGLSAQSTTIDQAA